jgi:hypothetical protein
MPRTVSGFAESRFVPLFFFVQIGASGTGEQKQAIGMMVGGQRATTRVQRKRRHGMMVVETRARRFTCRCSGNEIEVNSLQASTYKHASLIFWVGVV